MSNIVYNPFTQNFDYVGSGGGGGAITTIDGDSGSATGSTINLYGNTAPAATGLTFTGSSATLSLGGTLNVAHGGTGDTSLTAYAVLCGGTTSTNPVQSIASVGTSGQVLTSNGAAALPTMQGPITAKYAFRASLSANASNVTGDGTDYAAIWDTVDYDYASAYNNSTGFWTCPATGVYQFYGSSLVGGASGSTTFVNYLNHSGVIQNVLSVFNYAAVIAAGASNYSICWIWTERVTSGAQYNVTMAGYGGTKTITLNGPSTVGSSYFGANCISLG